MGTLGQAALILLLASGWYSMQHIVSLGESRLEQIEKDLLDVEQSPAFLKLQQVTRQNNLDRNYLNLARKKPTYLSLMLKELSNLTDRRISLENLNFQPTDSSDNMILQGTVASASTPPEIILAEFMKNLEASSMFSGVTAERHNKRREDGVSRIEFVLRLRGKV